MTDTSAGIHAAADRIRQTAKWLTISLATLGGVLIAGSQLSDIGKLQPSSSRFIVAIVGGGIAAAAAVTILEFSIWVAVTPLVSLKQLAERPPAGLGDTLEDPQFLGGMSKVADLHAAYTAALNERNLAFAALDQQYKDEGGAAAAAKAAAAAADVKFVALSGTVSSLIAAVAYMRVAYRWKRAGVALLACGVLAAAGIGAFAWAANPPDRAQASMATPAVLTAPERVTVTLTLQGQKALRNALGPRCPAASKLRALSLGHTEAGADVLIEQKCCKTVRFIAVADWASVLGK
jgi:nicotinamide riboside transporter PnuC